jgi:hypothetical protein
MRSKLFAAALWLFLAISAASAPAPDSELGQRIRARLDAYRDGNAATWASFVTDDCFCAGEKKADIIRSIENRPPAVKDWYGDIRELEVHAYGEFAVARYRITEFVEVNGKVDSLDQWRIETHQRRAGSWILVAAAENLVPSDPQAIVVPLEVLRKYVGAYEYTPGSVDVISLEGERIFVTSTGEAKVEIFAESETVFFAKGQPWRLVFLADGQTLAFRQHGQEYLAKRKR